MRVQADQHVVENGRVVDQRQVLEGAADAEGWQLVGAGGQQIPALIRQATAVGCDDAANDIEQGRLARAIRTDQAVDMSLAHRQVDTVQRIHAAEAHRDALYVQKRMAHACPFASLCTVAAVDGFVPLAFSQPASIMPSRPCGNKVTTVRKRTA